MVRLKLFVSGRSDLSERATLNARTFCATHFDTDYSLEIVDVIAQPQLAEEEGVVTTPTLIRCEPLPHRRLIGDMSDRSRVAMALGLASSSVPVSEARTA